MLAPSGLLAGVDEALVGDFAGAVLGGVSAPGLRAVAAATVCMVRARSSLAVAIVCKAWAAACLVPRRIWWIPVSSPRWYWSASLVTAADVGHGTTSAIGQDRPAHSPDPPRSRSEQWQHYRFSRLAMWLARNPERSRPDNRSFDGGRSSAMRPIRDLAVYWPHEIAEGPATGGVE
ncbi:hypothetical protein BST20_24335 [Mycobacterium branderi]|uniref:Uncharacterized protein n=1 Tax=Mycobacterium branderi TaxID=43348 RepID=A0AA91LSZ3_9MYCO|nr:hypothetical protein BST20_24335 [Mycobacterium branderi]